MKKLRLGILSTAKIGLEKVIPGMQKSHNCEIAAIASRDADRAKAAADSLNIPVAYDSYEALLDDASIDAVYIPLPNHLHVQWTIKAMAAGKHVLCEKPIGLSATDAAELLHAQAQYPNIKVAEAFMYRLHPQWQYVKKLEEDGVIGELRNIHSIFSYYNIDPSNIRNKKDMGGGGLMDIGCYCISLSRWLFNGEPARVMGLIEFDPELGIDRIASAVMDFETGMSLFTCSMQMAPFQRVHITGTLASIEIEIPFNAPPDKPTKIWLYTKSGKEEIVFDAVDQYTLQGEMFADAVLNNGEVTTSVQDAVNNMKVIDAVMQSATGRHWIDLEQSMSHEP
jgi:predicted dehydrogenase